MNNFAWWHRLRRHKVERRYDFRDRGWAEGLLAFAFYCRTSNSQWHWTVQ